MVWILCYIKVEYADHILTDVWFCVCDLGQFHFNRLKYTWLNCVFNLFGIQFYEVFINDDGTINFHLKFMIILKYFLY